jgi:ParB-like chromosome segregation protein Spo0J
LNIIEQLPVGELHPYDKNARTHSTKQVGQIAESIREFGFTNPILIDKEGMVLAGHGRLMAAKNLELETVPCIRLKDLSPEKARAYVLADNQLALNAGWDFDLLASELNEINSGEEVDLDLLGFSDEMLNRMIIDGEDDEPKESKTKKVEGSKEYKEDDFNNQEHQCPKCGFEF